MRNLPIELRMEILLYLPKCDIICQNSSLSRNQKKYLISKIKYSKFQIECHYCSFCQSQINWKYWKYYTDKHDNKYCLFCTTSDVNIINDYKNKRLFKEFYSKEKYNAKIMETWLPLVNCYKLSNFDLDIIKCVNECYDYWKTNIQQLVFDYRVAPVISKIKHNILSISESPIKYYDFDNINSGEIDGIQKLSEHMVNGKKIYIRSEILVYGNSKDYLRDNVEILIGIHKFYINRKKFRVHKYKSKKKAIYHSLYH
jgi:hypothetical protein